tara:strand:- start:3946 stop:5565 length:1620 start_codon:yes stop_codon:yes gene_type:complete
MTKKSIIAYIKKNKIKTYKELKESNKKAYDVSVKKYWLQDFDLKGHLSRGYWNYHSIRKEARKHKNKQKLKNKYPSAYYKAIRLGILNEICSHMPKDAKQRWNDKIVRKEAKKYATISSFIKGSPGAYQAAKKLGILDNCCKHMNKLRNIKWTEKTITIEAKKYKIRNDFKKKSGSAYKAAIRLNIIDNVCSHMTCGKTKWSKKNIIKTAKKCKNFNEFITEYNAAYKKAKSLNIIEQIKLEFIKRKRFGRQIKWTKNKIIKEAKKHKTITSFIKSYPAAYTAAKKIGILEEVRKSMKLVIGNRYIRMIYSFEFPDKSVYVGLTYDYDRRYREHMKSSKTIINKTNELGHTFIMFNEKLSAEDAVREESNLIKEYKKNGWNILNKAPAGGLGGTVKKWTKEKIIAEAKKYDTRSNFKKNNAAAYQAARRLGILDIVCSHMKIKLKRHTKESIIKEAKNYRTKKEFSVKSPSAYNKALKLGILNNACSHMVCGRTKWSKKKIKIIAKKYKKRSNFQKFEPNAYSAARRFNILDEACSHMK